MRSPYRKAILIIASMMLILFSLLVTCFGSANAQAEGDDLAFVYGTNHFNGFQYASAMIPSQVDTIYLLADTTNMLASRLTKVYYWPITNEFRADWDEANLIVEGSLEILKRNQLFVTLDLTDYTIQYDSLDKYGTLELSLGEAAVAARQRFLDLREKYRDDLFEYQRALNEYRTEMRQAQSDLEAGIITEADLPSAPEPLQDMTLFSTDLLKGFPVNLPVGEYDLQLRLSDGIVQPGSEKHLIVFREITFGVGYNVAAEERWNASEVSTDENETIYTLPGKTLFLKSFRMAQYNRKFYVRMNNPQDQQARSDQTTWVSLMPLEDARAILVSAGGSQEVESQGYYVQQITGSKLGYEIIDFDPATMTAPSFDGFKIKLEDTVPRYEIFTIDENGERMPGSFRRIRVLHTNRKWTIYLVSSLPLAIGFFVVLWRKSSVQRGGVRES